LAIKELEKIKDTFNRLAYANLTGRSERDRYLIAEENFHNSGHNVKHYPEWRANRITKIMTLLGISYDGMSVLELGGGTCYIGAFMAERGAKVLSLEGRIENVVKAQLRFEHLENLEIRQYDLEQGFSNIGKFDVTINFGFLEVIENIETIIADSVASCDRMLLETAVYDADGAELVFHTMLPPSEDNPLNPGKRGALPTQDWVERELSNHNWEWTRHDDPYLNAGNGKHIYDWNPDFDNDVEHFKRRFWDARPSGLRAI
jgi:SAM-dependent methyltransferase